MGVMLNKSTWYMFEKRSFHMCNVHIINHSVEDCLVEIDYTVNRVRTLLNSIRVSV